MRKKPDIKYLFEPRSVAVIGASRKKEKIGYKILENIVKGGYKGRVYPVNPAGGRILGLKAYKGIEEVEGDVDLACIAIPAKFVFEAVKGCARKNVKFIPIITSGFSEIGNIEEERRVCTYAQQNGMRILGPNIFGVYSFACSLNATFGPGSIIPGNVAIITQSGALGLSMIGKTALENMGLSTIVSVGNKSDVDEADLLEYLVERAETRIILVYIEGVRRGERLISALRKATRKKPVIVIKAGRSARGAMAAASHTGSLAGSDEVFEGVMKECGVLRAEGVEDAFNWCKFLSNAPLPKGENTVIITNGGGIGVMATDACEKYGVKLYGDAARLQKAFKGVTPAFGSTKNPIDLTGQATSKHYNYALEAALKSKDISSVIALYCETAVFDAGNLAGMISGNYRRYAGKKPVLFSVFGGKRTEDCVNALRKGRVSVFSDVYDAVSCFGAMYEYSRYLRQGKAKREEAGVDIGSIRKVVESASKEGRVFLLSDEAREVASSAGIRTPKSVLARGIGEAVSISGEIGYPVAMKVVSKDIIHKSDVGGIALGLENKDEVMDAYQVIMCNCRKRMPQALIKGVEISEMVGSGKEVIVGARRDPVFGPIVMFGLGGVYVEVLKDVSFRSLPISRNEIVRMMKETKAYPLLMGVRGEGKRDLNAVIDTIIKLGTIMGKCRLVTDIEVNPLVVYGQGEGVQCVDMRILLSNTKGEANG